MKFPTKCALLSAFVIPGLGQIYLKYYWRGLCFALVTLVSISLIVAKITEIIFQAIAILINESNGFIVLQNIIPIMNRVLKNQNLFYYHILEVVLVICWIWSTIDAFQLAKKTPEVTTTK